MRVSLSTSSEVFHYWANQTQPYGKCGNVCFDGPRVYSYGRHFMIARILPSGVVAFTLRGYSVTTSKHISQARQAANHMPRVFCNDPADSAFQNMRAARSAINGALHAAEKKGIRQTTRDGHKARALQLAEQANAYLAALPEDERAEVQPIDTSALESVRAEMVAAEQARERIKEEQRQARMTDLRESLEKWRKHEIVTRTGLYELPPALRLSYNGSHPLPVFYRAAGATVQTSHGAEIPVSDALKLWPIILRVMRGEKDYTPGEPLGPYRLTQIRTDGSIRVGCHDIAFTEIQGIARQLGLIESEVQA